MKSLRGLWRTALKRLPNRPAVTRAGMSVRICRARHAENVGKDEVGDVLRAFRPQRCTWAAFFPGHVESTPGVMRPASKHAGQHRPPELSTSEGPLPDEPALPFHLRTSWLLGAGIATAVWSFTRVAGNGFKTALLGPDALFFLSFLMFQGGHQTHMEELVLAHCSCRVARLDQISRFLSRLASHMIRRLRVALMRRW